MGMNGSSDIVLDEAAFEKASSEFETLADELQRLRNDIGELIDSLKSGFDTPAGRKFMKSCEDNLLRPLDRQKIVIEHVSSTLNDVKGKYSSVFSEYESLNTTIRSYKI